MKKKRHTAILELINTYEIETQEELVELLNKEGYNVTQATVSRDIKALRLLKIVSASGVYKYAKPDESKKMTANYNLLAQSAYSVDFAQNIVIIKTHSGMAQGAAAVLDAMNLTEIMGTIAGDDTIMCVTKTENDAKEVVSKIKDMM